MQTGADGGDFDRPEAERAQPRADVPEPVRPHTPEAMRSQAHSARARAEVARRRAVTAREQAANLRRRMARSGGAAPAGRAQDKRPPAEGGQADGLPAEQLPAEGPPGRDDLRVMLSRLASRGERLRAETAQLSEFIADEAERFADQLENLATRGDSERRISIAEVERRIAGIERRNASRLRAAPGGHTPLEPLPDLPGFHARGGQSAAHTEQPPPEDPTD